MKCYFLKAAFVLLAAGAAFLAVFLAMAFLVPGQYPEHFQRGFILQYRALEHSTVGRPKVIVLGASYMTFALDSDLLARKIDMPVYGLGVHGGMGEEYLLESVKPFLRKGDILVKPLWPFEAKFYGTDLILLTLDGEHDLQWSFIRHHPIEVLQSAGKYSVDKAYEWLIAPSVEKLKQRFIKGSIGSQAENDTRYTAKFFAPNGNFIFPGRQCILSEENGREKIVLNIHDFSGDTIASLNQLYDECSRVGCRMVLTFPPMYSGAVTDSSFQILDYENKVRGAFKAPLISSINQKLMPRDCIYDFVKHVNATGRERYTLGLAQDMCKSLPLSVNSSVP